MAWLDQTRESLRRTVKDPVFLGDCLLITSALDPLDCDQGRFLTLSYFANQLGKPSDVHRLTVALNFIASMPEAPLDVHGYVVTHGEHTPLNDDDFLGFLSTGTLVDPERGEEIMNAREKVFVYYSMRCSGAEKKVD